MYADNIAKFLFANGFKISTSKQAVLFRTNVQEQNGRQRQAQYRQRAPLVFQYCFLLGHRLRRETNLEQRCLKHLNALRAISGSSWGASKSSLLQVYLATIRSVMDYGSEAVNLGNERIKSFYEKIQAQAPAICCGSMHGTSIASLQILHTIFADRSLWRIVTPVACELTVATRARQFFC